MIRNKDYGIEQVIFSNLLLRHTELLDDTLSSVRAFHVSLIDNRGSRSSCRVIQKNRSRGRQAGAGWLS